MEKFSRMVDQVFGWIMVVILAVIPVFFLPVTPNFYDTNKWGITLVAGLVALIYFGVKNLVSPQIKLSFSPAAAAFGALFLASGLSILISSGNKVEALTNTSGILVFAALTLIFVFTGHLFREKMPDILTSAISIIGGIVAIVAIYMYFGIGKMMFPGVTFLSDPLWTPAGSSLSAIAVMVMALSLTLYRTISYWRAKNDFGLSLSVVTAALMVGGLALTAILIIPKLSGSTLPLQASWSILLDTYKQPKFMLFGVGPDNFLGAFTATRPSILNLGPLWSSRFTVSSTAFFHLATVSGVLGIAAMAMLFWALLERRARQNWGLYTAAAGAALALILTPPNITVFTVTACLLLLYQSGKTFTWEVPDHIKWVRTALALVALALILPSVYLLVRFYRGETAYYRAVKAAAANDGTLTYNLLIAALTANPYNTNYHITYSKTNLALADAIATQAQSQTQGQPATLSENDRNMISQLIQQAIREAKTATILSPNNVIAWETLAGIYQSITGIAQGAEQWTVAAFQQSIRLDPTNPVLRLSLAGVYMRQNDYDSALTELQTAALLKPDLANTHYNLAYAYRQTQNYFREAVSLKQTLTLIAPDGQDATEVKNQLTAAMSKLTAAELDAVNKIPPATATDTGPLSTPESAEEAVITPKIELPNDSSPAAQNP